MTKRKLVLGSRGSDLALAQAGLVQHALAYASDVAVDIKVIRTTGDRVDDVPFDRLEGKGFFTRELEQALLARRIDLAVHSLKDLMTTQPPGLRLGAVGFRDDRRELLIVRKGLRQTGAVLALKDGSTVGTSSARRRLQILALNPALTVRDLRGNVPTRINKLREGQYDAIVVAAAGVKRLGLDLSDLKMMYLDPERFLPAPGQGMLGIQVRADDSEVADLIGRLGTEQERCEAQLERGLLSRFELGCSLPLGVYSEMGNGRYRLKAVLGETADDGAVRLRPADVSGSDVEDVINKVYERLTREPA